MDIHWLEQSEADVPRDDGWLCFAEKQHLDALRVPKRRADWRLGRWTAKQAMSIYLKLPRDFGALASIEICPAPSGAPEAFVDRQPAPASISLSHSHGNALCAVASRDTGLGCDVEHIETRSDAFLADYFTADEQALVAQALLANRPLLETLIWSAKESALKALREGLRLDTHSVTVILSDANSFSKPSPDATSGRDVTLPASNWQPLLVRCASGESFHGWWQRVDDSIQTVVAKPASASPTQLQTGNCC